MTTNRGVIGVRMRLLSNSKCSLTTCGYTQRNSHKGGGGRGREESEEKKNKKKTNKKLTYKE